MNDEQFKQLVTVLRQATEKKYGWGELLMRAGVTLSTTGIVFIGSLLWSMNQHMTLLMAEQQMQNKQLARLEKFSDAPRFTQDMFTHQTRYIIDRIENNRRDIDNLQKENHK